MTYKKPKTLQLGAVAPSTPHSLHDIQLVKATVKGVEKTFKVQRHGLGLCEGCHGHANKLCDHVQCYEKSTPVMSYRLVDLTFNKRVRELRLGE